MKRVPLNLILFISLAAHSQKIEKFYSFDWKECEAPTASFYTVIEKKDSGWFRNDYYIQARKLQMQGLFKDEECKVRNGTFYYLYANGKLEQSGRYANDKKEGLWISFYANGMTRDSTYYMEDKPVRISMKWHPNGYASDSINISEDGKGVFINWFDNGTLSSAGYKTGDKQQGKWKYYHRNGKQSAVEIYDNGILKSREYYNESGVLLNDTANKDRNATFPGGGKAWGNFLEGKVYFPSQYKFKNGDGEVTVMLDLTIDEEGNIGDVEVSIPFHKDFDDIAIKALRKSPQWLPAISHNRRVACNVRQPFTFTQITN